MIEARRPNIVVVDKVKKETMIIDVTISGDIRTCDREREKIEKYSFLKDKIARLWEMKKVVAIAIVVGALGTWNLIALELRSELNMFRNQHC